MQTAQLIKMICVISNYPTNTMQTSREDCRGPHCLEPFLPLAWGRDLWENRCVGGGRTPVIHKDQCRAGPQRIWAKLRYGSAVLLEREGATDVTFPTGGLRI